MSIPRQKYSKSPSLISLDCVFCYSRTSRFLQLRSVNHLNTFRTFDRYPFRRIVAFGLRLTFIRFRQEGALAAKAEEALLRNRLTFAVLKLEA